jgi:hypothetical protein
MDHSGPSLIMVTNGCIRRYLKPLKERDLLVRKCIVIFAMLSFPFLLVSCATQSQSTRRSYDISEAEPENVRTIRSTPITSEELKPIKRIAIFISGSETFLTTMMEDALSIDLQNLGFDVVKRLEIEKRVTKEWKERYKDWYSEYEKWYSLPDSTKLQLLPPKPIDELEIARNEIEIGKLVDADAVLTGTILEGRQQYSTMKEGSGAGAEKIVITAISLQLIDVKKERVLFEILIGYTHGVSIPYVSKDVMEFLSDKMK